MQICHCIYLLNSHTLFDLDLISLVQKLVPYLVCSQIFVSTCHSLICHLTMTSFSLMSNFVNYLQSSPFLNICCIKTYQWHHFFLVKELITDQANYCFQVRRVICLAQPCQYAAVVSCCACIAPVKFFLKIQKSDNLHGFQVFQQSTEHSEYKLIMI